MWRNLWPGLTLVAFGLMTTRNLGCAGGGGGGGGAVGDDGTGGGLGDDGAGGGGANDGTGDGDVGTDGDDAMSGDDGGTITEAAIVKTQIGIGIDGRIGVGDDLIVYGVGLDEDNTTIFDQFNQPAGVHYLTPSQTTSDSTGGTMIPGSDVLYDHRTFNVAGKKIALERSNNLVSIYDTQTEQVFDIAPTLITLSPLSTDKDDPGQMISDGTLIATINRANSVADGNAIKVIDVSGSEPLVIGFPNPVNEFDEQVVAFDQVAIDADIRRLAAVGSEPDDNLYLWDIDDPQNSLQIIDFGVDSVNGIIDSTTRMRLDGDNIIYHDNAEFNQRVAVFNISTRQITVFDENLPGRSTALALAGDSFAYYLARENADREEEAGSNNVFLSAIGTIADLPGSTLASQFDRYAFRSSVVGLNSSAEPAFSQEACLGRKLIGYAASVCVTPDGSRWFMAGWRGVDGNYDYVQMSTGGAFTDFADPEGSSVTGSLMGADIVCSGDTVAFRGLRQEGVSGCFTNDVWIITFIVLDRLN